MKKTKRCRKCNQLKQLDEFYASQKKDNRTGQCIDCFKQYYLENKERIKNRSKEYYRKNKDEISYKHKSGYYKKNKEIKRKHYLKHKADKQWISINLARIEKHFTLWLLGKPDNRKLIVKNGKNTLTMEQIKKLYLKNPYCSICEKTNIKMLFEHILPLNKGGQNNINNIRIICENCIKGQNAL